MLVIVPNPGPNPINIQSIILVPANRWRRTDGGGRSCWTQHFDALRGGQSVISLRTPIKLWVQPIEDPVLRRPARGDDDAQHSWQTAGQRWRNGWWCLLVTLLWFWPENFFIFPLSFCETTARMEQAPTAPSPPPKPVNHEPISFGIDQILGGGTEPENGRTAGRQTGSDSSNVSDGYYSLGSPTAASAPSYTALSISLSGIMPSVEPSGSYAENRSLGSRGVIRVPAHRPMTATGPPAPVQSAVTGFGGLCFPWIGNRFAKDRISGRLLLF